MLQKTFSALIQPSLFVPLVAVHNLLNVVGRLGKVRQSATTSAAAAAVGAFRPCIREQQRSPRPVDSSSPLCWSQAQEKREGWKPHFCKTTHTQNPQRNTTHRHQPRNSDLFKFFRGRTPGLIAWAVAMNKPAKVARMMTVQLNVDMEWERYNVRSIHH
nr:unnamed protein product [Callosobruchus chinensis]